MDPWLLIWEGILYGLTLTILLGPIFVALTQTGIEKGLRAGLLVGVGIWVSDILIITLLTLLMDNFTPDDLQGDFKTYFGIGGGIVLIAFGFGTARKKSNFMDEKVSFTAKSMGGYWLKGFLVNTVNPFTFIFWTTLITGYVVVENLSKNETLLFFGTIIFTIMVTDSLKVIGAKAIRKKLSKDKVDIISKVAGIALIGFGIALAIRSLV
jgi:threonine/homoserine/homoserine lactone efflux protein